MAVDRKYGRVTLERGTVGEDEPVVVFRGQDELLLPLLAMYEILCDVAGASQQHMIGVAETKQQIFDWQLANRTKIPTSDPIT